MGEHYAPVLDPSLKRPEDWHAVTGDARPGAQHDMPVAAAEAICPGDRKLADLLGQLLQVTGGVPSTWDNGNSGGKRPTRTISASGVSPKSGLINTTGVSPTDIQRMQLPAAWTSTPGLATRAWR